MNLGRIGGGGRKAQRPALTNVKIFCDINNPLALITTAD